MGKTLFKLGFYMKRPEVIRSYKEIKSLNNNNLQELEEYQNRLLRKLISHAVKEVPYYENLFKTLKLSVNDIETVKDLIKLPILTKEDIKKDPESFISKKYLQDAIKGSTGGSTGKPLKYYMSNKDYSMGVAQLLRGFEFAGYKLGDSMAIIAGSSLVSSKQSIKSKINDWVMNFKHYSSYGMSEEDLEEYYRQINKTRPRFIRGYASSIYLFAKYIKDYDLSLKYDNLSAIFTTAEKLMPQQRKIIEEVFGCEVFDNYGLNDGGISAFECNYHQGLHIDYERSILEVTSFDGESQLLDKQGKLIATSLHNYVMPFIRYDTGDLGSISSHPCECGCSRPLLREISGRVTDYLKINGTYIGSPVLTVLMGRVDTENYQIIQTGENSIEINIIKGSNYTAADEDFISNSFREHVQNINIRFNYFENLSGFMQSNNKFKFIINTDYR
ncbi:phenylacetate--CoA ligase family protein [Lysinibacillus sphaericus]